MDKNPERTDEHSLSEKQTNTDDHKASTVIAAVTDPKFPLPVLDENATTLRYVLSFGTLATLLAGGLAGAWYVGGVAMLQSEQPLIPLTIAFFAILGALFFTGTVYIDWWELVLGYWWLAMPLGAAVGIMLVFNEERSAGIGEST